MTKWWLLGGAIVCEVAASLSLQAAITHPLWYIVVVIDEGAGAGQTWVNSNEDHDLLLSFYSKVPLE